MAIHTRAFTAATGRTSGEKSPTYRRSASVEELERPVQVAFGLPDRGHRDARPVAVLGQAVLLAQLPGPQQLLPGALEVVPLAEDGADPDVHVRRAPQHGATLPGGERQPPLEDAQRLAQPTLREPDVGQGEPAPDDVREVTGLLQARHGRGIPAGRRLEIPARPGGECQEPGCASTRKVVVLADEVQRPPGMGRGAGHVAEDQGLAGPVHGDRARQATERRLVDDDHRARWRGSPVRGLVRRVEPPLGVPQPLLDALDLAPDEERPGVGVAQHGPDAEQLVGERLEPPPQRGLLPILASRRDRKLHQVRRPRNVPARHRVADGLGAVAVLLVPLACPTVQLGRQLGLLVQEARPQDVGEELVVAVPLAPVVERDEEQVASIERLQHGLAPALAGHGVAQRAGQPVEDRGLQQEAPARVRAAGAGPLRPGSRRCSGRPPRSPR